jgi:hypothetical protein
MTEVGEVVGDDDAQFLKYWSGAAADLGCHKGEHTIAEGTNVCSLCGFERVCDNPDGHYEVTADGHRVVESCDVCGVTAQETAVPHTSPELQKSKGDKVTTYSYVCSTCDHTVRSWTVSNDVNYYSAPSETYNNWNSGGDGSSCVATGELSSDTTYNRIQIGEGASFEFSNGSMTPVRGFGVDQSTSSSAPYDAGDTINGGSGKYFVLRYRLHGPTLLKLLVNSNSRESAPEFNENVTCIKVDRVHGEVQDEWRTIVIDIASLNSAYYNAEDPDCTNVVVGLYFEGAGNLASVPEAERYVDIAYFAIVDNMSEVASVVGNDAVELLSDFRNDLAVDCACHKGEHIVEEGKTTCSVCGEAQE